MASLSPVYLLQLLFSLAGKLESCILQPFVVVSSTLTPHIGTMPSPSTSGYSPPTNVETLVGQIAEGMLEGKGCGVDGGRG